MRDAPTYPGQSRPRPGARYEVPTITTTSAKVAGRVGRTEFVLLMASTMALTALSIDLMLPAFDEMRSDFALPSDSTETAAIITVFFFGLSIAQLVYGPMADRFGRKPILFAGLVIFVLGAIGSSMAGSLEGVLVFRFVWGVGSAGPRVLSLSIIRDIYEGDQMARVMSFIAAVFIFVPVVAPSAGALLLHVAGWRFLFLLAALLAASVGVWLLRLPETLDRQHRIKRLEIRSVMGAARMVVTNRQAAGYTLALTFSYGAFVSYLASSELVWADVFDRGDQFPLIFGGLALAMGVSILANGTIVDRIGTRRIIHGALLSYVTIAGVGLIVSMVASGTPNFWVFVILLGAVLASHGLLLPNANSLAMAQLGDVAGTASAMIGAVSIMGGALLGAVIDRTFNGTVTPMITGFFLASLAALIAVVVTERGRLFGAT